MEEHLGFLCRVLNDRLRNLGFILSVDGRALGVFENLLKHIFI